MPNHQNYDRIIYSDVEESLSKIVNKISKKSIVLDIGCGSGMLGAYLSEKKECIVDGVDYDESAIELCKASYRFTAVRNIETELLTDVFKAKAYDFIVVADVIEHLVKPDLLLSELQKLVKPEGVIIFSVPNVTHIAVGFELLLGDFDYKNNGLLDSTHVKFYSKDSLLKKLESSGLYPCEIDTVKKNISETEFSDHISRLFPTHWINELISQREDALTYQWIISTQTNANSVITANSEVIHNTHIILPVPASNLYWLDMDDNSLAEERKLVGHLNSKNNDQDVIEFYFAQCGLINNMQKIRIDPISDKKMFLMVRAEILSSDNNVVWEWDSQNIEKEIYGAKLIDRLDSNGCLLQALDNDPHWFPTISEEILAQITIGWIFKLSIKTDESLFKFYNNELSGRLTSILASRDEQIVQYQKEVVDYSQQISCLNNRIADLENSNSWRITRPLRELEQLLNRLSRAKLLYRKYSYFYPGFFGIVRLTFKCIRIILTGGFQSLRNRMYYYEHGPIRSKSGQQAFLPTHKTFRLDESSVQIDKSALFDVAVHVHIYYTDMVQDICSYLANIPVAFHLYITTDTVEKAKIIEPILKTLKNIKVFEVHITENRGRDIFPMLVLLGSKLVNHELVLHIHTKRSPHDSWNFSGWQRYLMESLLGNSQRVTAIFDQFMKNKDLGMLFPEYFHPVRPFIYTPREYNQKNIERLLVRAGRSASEERDIDKTFFPAGDMFWFRGKAIKPFIDINLSAKDFEQENGQVDGTLAHAVERLFPYFARQVGLISRAYLAKSFHSPECSAHNFDLFRDYLGRGLIRKPTILFDHNGGGGTNVYTRELAENIHKQGGTVLRIYCHNAIWFVHWIGDRDAMLFFTNSVNELIENLSISDGVNIIINSLYGHPDIKATVAQIILLAERLKAPIDVKIHDFFILCPSPHLSDNEEKYCGVPKDFNICANCLKKNTGWFHDWYPKGNMPTEITKWREPFSELLHAATQITFFDKSSVEIVQKAFILNESKIKIIPHRADYIKGDKPADVSGPLRIGILGTLSQTKGGNVVNALCDYIEEFGLKIPITVVGPSVVNTHKKIVVHGFYDQQELASIINMYGVNVILMPSIVPETFSYTISEAMKLNLPIVAFDLGAQGNRVVEYALGKVIPLGSTPEIILEAIQSVLKKVRELRK